MLEGISSHVSILAILVIPCRKKNKCNRRKTDGLSVNGLTYFVRRIKARKGRKNKIKTEKRLLQH